MVNSLSLGFSLVLKVRFLCLGWPLTRVLDPGLGWVGLGRLLPENVKREPQFRPEENGK